MKTLLTLLKKLLTLLKKAIGIPLFVWLFLFLVWYGLINYYASNVYEDKTVHLQILIALNLVGLTMFITLFGYLFSVAINVDADVILIDEILAVGDQRFQDKCMKKMLELKTVKLL